MVSRRGDGTLGASIVDPHGDHLADARSKLRAHASLAAEFAERFARIESIARVDQGLRVLDQREKAVRSAVLAFEGGKVSALFESEAARPYL